MATRPASENPFPEILLAEVAAPSTPAAGHARFYLKSDGKLYWKDDGGNEHVVSDDAGVNEYADLTDVDVTGLADGDIMYWDDGDGAWKPAAPPSGGGGGGLTLLHTVTLGSAAATIGQSGISGSYKDLLVVAKLRGTAAAETVDAWLQVGNGSIDTGNNYGDQSTFEGTGTGGIANSATDKLYLGPCTAGSATAGLFYSIRFEILDYIAAATYRAVFGQGFHVDSNRYVHNMAGMWKDASDPIDILTLTPDSGNFATGSRLYIYGRG